MWAAKTQAKIIFSSNTAAIFPIPTATTVMAKAASVAPSACRPAVILPIAPAFPFPSPKPESSDSSSKEAESVVGNVFAC